MLPNFQPLKWRFLLLYPADKGVEDVTAAAARYLNGEDCALILRDSVDATAKFVPCRAKILNAAFEAVVVVRGIELELSLEASYPGDTDEEKEREKFLTAMAPLVELSPERDLFDGPVLESVSEAARAQAYGTPIDEMVLSVRTYNVLKNTGCETVGDIVKSAEKFLSAHSADRPKLFGRNTRAELVSYMAELGFVVSGDQFVYRPTAK